MLKEFEENRSPGGSDIMLSKLRERLKENERALEVCGSGAGIWVC